MKPMTKTTTSVIQLIFGFTLFLVFLLSSCSSEVEQEEEEETETEIEEEDPPIEFLSLSDIFPRKGNLRNAQNTISQNQYGEYFLTGSDFKDPYCIEIPPPYDYISCESTGVFLYKFDSDGMLLWELNWEDEEATVVLATSDGGCYLGTDEDDIIIRKISSDGEVIWKKEIGGDSRDYLYDFTLNAEDELICIGKTNNFGADSYGNIWTFHLSQNGDILWSQIYVDEDQEIPHSIISTQDNGCLVIGENADNHTDPVLILLRYNPQGELLWVQNHQLNDWTIGTSALETDDGNVIITGSVYESYTTSNLLLLKVNSLGEIIWNKEIDNLEGSERGQRVYEGENEEIIVVGTSTSGRFVATFDQQGNQISIETLEAPYTYSPNMVFHNNSERTVFYNQRVETQDTVFEYIKYTEVEQ